MGRLGAGRPSFLDPDRNPQQGLRHAVFDSAHVETKGFRSCVAGEHGFLNKKIAGNELAAIHVRWPTVDVNGAGSRLHFSAD